jgi:hypothetical protein
MAPRNLMALIALAVVSVLAVSCGGGDDEDASMTLTLSGDECTYEGPSQVSAGSAVITIENKTDENAVFVVFELSGDFGAFAQEIEEKQAVLEEEGEVAPGLATVLGDTASVDLGPGESGELPSGDIPLGLVAGNQYALWCANFVGERPFSASTAQVIAWPAPTSIQVTE